MFVCYQLLTNRTIAPLMVHAAKDLLSPTSQSGPGRKANRHTGFPNLGLIKQGTVKASRTGAYTTF